MPQLPDDALATIDQLLPRLADMPDGDEQKELIGALSDLSDEARYYGSSLWTTPDNTPPAVVRLVIKAAARFARNPDGYVQSRAGDETLEWNTDKEEPGSAHFLEHERERLMSLAGKDIDTTGSLFIATISPWNTRYQYDYSSELVACEGAHTKMPYFAEADEWLYNNGGPIEVGAPDPGRVVARIVQTSPTIAVVVYTDGSTSILTLPTGSQANVDTAHWFFGHGVPADPYPGAVHGDLYLDLDTETIYLLME